MACRLRDLCRQVFIHVEDSTEFGSKNIKAAFIKAPILCIPHSRMVEIVIRAYI
jgi:hypothetical protein